MQKTTKCHPLEFTSAQKGTSDDECHCCGVTEMPVNEGGREDPPCSCRSQTTA